MSGRVVIVANGVPASDTAPAAWVRQGDLLIAADGGARLLRENDLVPDYVIGDFDSLTAIELVDGSQRINLIAPNHDHQIVGKSGDTVSLIPIGNKASGVTTHGLQWGLDDETLEFGTTRGVSNVIIATKASVAIREGLLICVVSNNQHVEEILET